MDVEGDEGGEFTYTGARGHSVIDLVIGNGEVREKIERLEAEGRVKSDHHPVVVWIEGKWNSRKRERREGRRQWRGVWDERGKENFKRELGSIEWKEKEIERKIKRMTKRMRKVIRKEEESREGKKGKNGWWDEECKEEKGEVRRTLRRWKKGGEEEEYKELKRKYKEVG